METRWLYTISEDFPALVEASKKTCVIPMGCVEKHGRHLPLGTDVFEASTVAYRASQIEPVCIFPDFTFGDVPEASISMPPGSITLPMDMEMDLLELLCMQCARNGFTKIIIANGHGGNRPWLTSFMRKMQNRYHPFVPMIFHVRSSGTAPYLLIETMQKKGREYFPELTDEDVALLQKYYDEKIEIGHACMGETASVMGICPETVRLDRLGGNPGLSRHLADKYGEHNIEIRDGGWDINFPDRISGHDAVGCNERIGKAAIRANAERFAAAIRYIKEDKDLVRWHNEMWGSDLPVE